MMLVRQLAELLRLAPGGHRIGGEAVHRKRAVAFSMAVVPKPGVLGSDCGRDHQIGCPSLLRKIHCEREPIPAGTTDNQDRVSGPESINPWMRVYPISHQEQGHSGTEH